ncbi:hypothetical protein F4777DRAFT_576471 [Nemania sp. FL0916]|nr:hypothetical protein F4777DRAFT_576471 [Nemania sp. FL0916]
MAPFDQLEAMAADASRYLSTGHDMALIQRQTAEKLDFRDPQTLVVIWVSLPLAIISLITALFAFYWFVRMRRGFRQDMILLLIQSDLFKTFWLFINPLFYLIGKKPFMSDWVYCQISGFFLAVAFQASDIAVLLIAVHTVLFIVRRQHPGTAGPGLQPYRRIAYAVWAVVPVLFASIVPITGASFVDDGALCYLPLRPGWYSMGLGWIPHFVVFGLILISYTWLYFYVFLRFRRFGEDQRRASSHLSSRSMTTASSTTRQHHSKRKLSRSRSRSAPTLAATTPLLTTHDLPHDASTPTTASNKSATSKFRQGSVGSTVSTLQIGDSVLPLPLPATPEQAVRKNSVTWNLVDFGVGTSLRTESTHHDDDHAAATASTSAANLTVPEQTYTGSHGSRRGRAFFSSYSALLPGVLPEDRGGNGQGHGQGETQTQTLTRIETEADAQSETQTMQHTRDRTQRQLRLLFVFPVIYMLTWVAPFVAHLYRHDQYSSNSLALIPIAANGINSSSESSDMVPVPLALRIASIASLCLGAAVDSAFFTAWEQPWQHRRGGFWANLAARLRFQICITSNNHTGYSSSSGCGSGGGRGSDETGPGRTWDERLVDERVARLRRDREQEEMERRSRARKNAEAEAEAVNGERRSTRLGTGAGSVGDDGSELRASGEARREESSTTDEGGYGHHATRARREWWDAWDDDQDDLQYQTNASRRSEL